MASPVRLYQQEMHDNLGFYPTWLPSDRIDVGDVGVLQAGRFRKMASLKELGIDIVVEDAGAAQDIQYTATKGVSIDMAVGASALTAGKAEISIAFSASGAFVFHAAGLRQRGIRDRLELADGMKALAKREKWQDQWLLVESIHTAKRATVIVSEDSSAGLVLAASADVSLPGVSLADPRVNLNVTSTHGRLVHIIGAEDLCPLYSCLRLRRRLFGGPVLDVVRGGGTAESPLVRPGIDELLDS
jgi:hypothetical protein